MNLVSRLSTCRGTLVSYLFDPYSYCAKWKYGLVVGAWGADLKEQVTALARPQALVETLGTAWEER